ncbi:MAG: hypothetical protein ABNH21_14285 [Glaciecola sp.]|jgi:hypothetical protein
MIHVFNLDNTHASQSSFSFGVPLPQGTFWPEQNLQLVDESGQALVASIHPTALWHDKSIRWCLIESQAPDSVSMIDSPQAPGKDKAQPNIRCFITSTNAKMFRKVDCATKHDKYFELSSKEKKLRVDKHSALHFQECNYRDSSEQAVANSLSSHLLLQTVGHTHNIEALDSSSFTRSANTGEPIYAQLEQAFRIQLANSPKHLQLYLQYQLDYRSNALTLRLSLHNPMPIVQEGGQWDLGNQNSVELSQFGLVLECPGSALSVSCIDEANSETATNNDTEFEPYENWSLLIENSGGDNWQSKNHVNKHGQIKLGERGALLTKSTNGDAEQARIMRPKFTCALKNQDTSYALSLEQTWETFPLKVSGESGKITVDFAPNDIASFVELQAGEIKTHTINIQLSGSVNEPSAIALPLMPVPSSDLFCDSNTIPWLRKSVLKSPLAHVVDMGLSGERNFLNKREALDEFGWRNFGDIYADHEAVGHKGDDIFVSHYNNQYDPLFGFLKQWLLTGDTQWKQLADDLFEHIVNIDIYHTTLDKLEYNGGLFWHTDHYVEAETATHRTYSKRQQQGVYEDHAGGGGPGSHHCYTSGLALYHQLSGNVKAKEAVLKLSTWISYFFEGDGTLLGTLLQYRNKAIVRNPLTGQYPLDRGVANYVNALIDSYELSSDAQYIEKASNIILHTFSHEDDIADRNFEDIENTWYYIVFMQSVAKYLWICETVYGISHDYAPIKKAFLHYVEYIATSEVPYLQNSERLEYPNDTWTAQDLRKIMVLKVAEPYLASNKELHEKVADKIRTLTEYVEAKLIESDEKDYTRILALIMQNNMSDKIEPGTDTPKVTVDYQSEPYSLLGFAWRFLKQYSIKREIKHLFIRFPQLKGKKAEAAQA